MKDELEPYTLYKIAGLGGMLFDAGWGLAKGLGNLGMKIGAGTAKVGTWGVGQVVKHPGASLTVGMTGVTAPGTISRQINNVNPNLPYMG